MRKIFALFSLLSVFFITLELNAQGLCAYTDYMDKFFVFDNGKKTQIDHIKPQSYKIGGKSILYVSGNGHLMQYLNGKVITIDNSIPTDYFSTDYISGYTIYNKLIAIYEGNKIVLSNSCKEYTVGDSLIVFYDETLESLNIFYNGEILKIESGLIGFPVRSWACGDNILAYISDRNDNFNVWYQGKSYLIERNVETLSYKAGKDIIAYTTPTDQTFNVFDRGNTTTIESFIPESFQVGNGFVAYVDNMGEFKIFKGNKTGIISTNTPDSYTVQDNILIYSENNYFYVYYNGESIELEAYTPNNYKIGWNTVLYQDLSNRLFIFQNGEKKFLSNDLINNYTLHRDLVHLQIKQNKNQIYYNKRFY